MPVIENENLNWQSNLRSRNNRLIHLYETGILSDVCFIVGPQRIRIKAHKLVLMMSSCVFEKMFESKSRRVDIEVEDIQPQIFKAMLRFLYHGDISINKDDVDSVLNLFIVANTYKIDELIRQCCVMLIHKINDSNVLSIHQLAHIKRVPELMNFSFQYICRNASSVLKNEDAVQHLTIKTLQEFASSDYLNIDELVLVQFIMKWAKVTCKIFRTSLSQQESLRSILQKVLPHIRFNLLDPLDISCHVTPQKLFTDEELVQMFIAASAPKQKSKIGVQSPSTDLETNQKINDKGTPRIRFAYVNRFTGKKPSPALTYKMGDIFNFSMSTTYSLGFKVNKSVRVVGAGIFGFSNLYLGEMLSPELVYEARILSPERKTLSRVNGSCKNTGEIVHLTFVTPVDIQPDVYYTISAAINVRMMNGMGSRYIGTGWAQSVCKVPWMGEIISFEFKKTPGFIFSFGKEAKEVTGESAIAANNSGLGEFPYICFQ